MTNSIARLARTLTVAFVATTMFTGCDILDVDNPNNLLEDDVQKPAAANALVNGTLSLVADAAAEVWQPIAIASDELVWIGSRDAWQQLDFGFISNPSNEFTDAIFPLLGRARWQADVAETIVAAHAKTTPTTAMNTDLARAHLFAGMIYMIIGEVQQDFAFSDKQEPAANIGSDKMHTVLDQAIAKLDKAVALATTVNNADLITRATAVRARARHSRAIYDKVKPAPNTTAPLVSNAGAVTDAQTVLARTTGDWKYQFTYSAATIANGMATWVNSRSENQFDTLSLVTVDQKVLKAITAVRLRDPIDNVPDPVVRATLVEWKTDSDISKPGTVYAPLTLVSARMMRLIIAEDALQKNDMTTFRTQINAIRALNNLTPYDDQIPAIEILKHERRVNLLLTGLRLNDMYRFGIKDPHWKPNSDAITKPGTKLPITDIELRANPLIK